MRRLTQVCVMLLALAALPSIVRAQAPAPSLAKETAATFQNAANQLLGVAEAMPPDKYGFKPAGAEISSFGDQLMHVAGIVQRFVDSAKGTKTDMPHGAMAKPEIIAMLKKTFQGAEETMAGLSDAQMLEPVKFPIGDRTVTRATFWQGPLFQLRNHYGQLVVYLRMNGIVPPASRR